MSRQIVLDTETTGLEHKLGHRIIEIGCVELLERRPTGRTYHQYINPQREFEQGAAEVTGLSLEFLSDKPLFSAIAVATAPEVMLGATSSTFVTASVTALLLAFPAASVATTVNFFPSLRFTVALSNNGRPME